MSYYKLLSLKKEPFSTSPDPTLFYPTDVHKKALYRLAVSVQLKRGLGLVLGDVGTGKTTLSRHFVRLMAANPKMEMHLLLNPIYDREKDFLIEICHRFGIELPETQENEIFYFKKIEDYLFNKGVHEQKTVVLLIDEAQKLSVACLEVLRGLLNYETNEYKLLQVVLFSQMEIVPKLLEMKNFWDRISVRQELKPLNFQNMCAMVSYRLCASGYDSPVSLFEDEALWAIYRATKGFPRQITQLCHDCLEHLVMYDQTSVDDEIVSGLVAARG